MRSIPATASCRRTRTSRRRCSTPASTGSARRPDGDAHAGQQGGGAQRRRRRRRAGDAGHRRRCRDDLDECKRLAAGIGYPVMLKASWGGGGRGMRVIESRGRARGGAGRRAARGAGGVRQRRGLFREAGATRAPRRGADPRRHARQLGASVRARLHRAAAQPEGGRARAGAVSRRSRPRRAVRQRAEADAARSATPTPARSSS